MGLLPSLVPIIDNNGMAPWLIMVGSVGTLIFPIGSLMVLWLVWKSRLVLASQRSTGLFWFALAAFATKTIMQAIHLLLLGFISTALFFIITQKSRSLKQYPLVGSLTYQLGIGSMVFLLFGIGLMQILKVLIYFDFQLWLFVTGVLVWDC